MTQILFTVVVVIVVLYGAKALSSMRSVGSKAKDEGPSTPKPPKRVDEDLVACPVCGTFSVSAGPAGCPSCSGNAPS